MKNSTKILLKLPISFLMIVTSFLTFSCIENSQTSNIDSQKMIFGASRFASFFQNPYDIYMVDIESGKELSKKDVPTGDEMEPSPVGEWAIYSTRYTDGSRAGGNSEIYLVNLIDRRIIQVTHDSKNDYDPTWSPDGEEIAYVSGSQIATLSMECFFTSNSCSLAPSPSVITNGYSPDWSPDGDSIVYQLDGHIFLLSTNDGKQTDLTLNLTNCSSPKWAPNGGAIAFVCNDDIYLLNLVDNSTLQKIFTVKGYKSQVDWSPDGSKITFVSDLEDFGLGKRLGTDGVRSTAIFMMNADGTELVQVSLRYDESILWYTWYP